MTTSNSLFTMNDTCGDLALRFPTETKSSSLPPSTSNAVGTPSPEDQPMVTNHVPYIMTESLRPGPHSIVENGLQLLYELLGLKRGPIPSSLYDAVLVAIDFENINHIQGDLTLNSESQVGLAILDTRNLTCDRSENLIATYNFASGSSSYQTRASKRFLFGESVALRQDSMLENIQSLIPQDRNVILIGHDIKHDLQALRALKFNFRTVTNILDTLSISIEVNPNAPTSLRQLLIRVGCPFTKLHCGGNDANFTLRALLLLAATSCVEQDEFRERLDIIKDAALKAPLSSWNSYHSERHDRPAVVLHHSDMLEAKAAKKNAKRLQRSRKHQSKSWDIETQGRIRAERAAKRLVSG